MYGTSMSLTSVFEAANRYLHPQPSEGLKAAVPRALETKQKQADEVKAKLQLRKKVAETQLELTSLPSIKTVLEANDFTFSDDHFLGSTDAIRLDQNELFFSESTLALMDKYGLLEKNDLYKISERAFTAGFTSETTKPQSLSFTNRIKSFFAHPFEKNPHDRSVMDQLSQTYQLKNRPDGVAAKINLNAIERKMTNPDPKDLEAAKEYQSKQIAFLIALQEQVRQDSLNKLIQNAMNEVRSIDSLRKDKLSHLSTRDIAVKKSEIFEQLDLQVRRILTQTLTVKNLLRMMKDGQSELAAYTLDGTNPIVTQIDTQIDTEIHQLRNGFEHLADQRDNQFFIELRQNLLKSLT